MKRLEIVILGCGSSGGVPRVGGDWGVCDPTDKRNRRMRCSLLLRQWSEDGTDPTVVLVDTSPDLREQFLRADVRRLDAILFSHDHADQTHGIDDVRSLVYLNRKLIDVYMDTATAATLERRFHYTFHGAGGYPPILRIAHHIEPLQPFSVPGPGGPMQILPLPQEHGAIASLGFRVGPFAYCNDVSNLPDATLAALEGVELLIVDALRYTPHPSHAHVAKTLGWIEQLHPKHAVLTNLHVDLDYQRLAAELPPGVEPAYDGWTTQLHISHNISYAR